MAQPISDTIPGAAPLFASLGGLLGSQVDQINADESVIIELTLRVNAEVGVLELYRMDVSRLGFAAPSVTGRTQAARATAARASRQEPRIFLGSAFQPEAFKFFGPPRDGEDVEAYLQACFKACQTRKTLVDLVNSCRPEKKWSYTKRNQEFQDFCELMREFKAACPDRFDQETGAPKYAEPGFIGAYIASSTTTTHLPAGEISPLLYWFT